MPLGAKSMTTHTRKHKQTVDDKSQVAAFRKAARELGLDESEERFQATLRTLAKHKSRPEPVKKKAD